MSSSVRGGDKFRGGVSAPFRLKSFFRLLDLLPLPEKSEDSALFRPRDKARCSRRASSRNSSSSSSFSVTSSAGSSSTTLSIESLEVSRSIFNLLPYELKAS